jgi:membrane protease subunit HflC
LAPAVRDAEILMGKADAEALATYASAYSEDPEFYSFWRSIQAYRKSLSSGTSIVTSTTSNYYRSLFEDPNRGFNVQAEPLTAAAATEADIAATVGSSATALPALELPPLVWEATNLERPISVKNETPAHDAVMPASVLTEGQQE